MQPLQEFQRQLTEKLRAPQPHPGAELSEAACLVPRLLDVAVHHANSIVDAVPRYSSLDHAINWATLIGCIARLDDFDEPCFEISETHAATARRLWIHEQNCLGRQHFAVSFERQMWQLVDDGGGARIRLSEPMRRSALHLLGNKAAYVTGSEEVQGLLAAQDWTSEDSASSSEALQQLTRALGLTELAVFSESCPEAWKKLDEGLPFPLQALPGFRSFVVWHSVGGPRWGRTDQLPELFAQYAEEAGLESLEPEVISALIAFHALTPQEAREWGLQSPFLLFDGFYASWPFAWHVLPPDLNFLALLVRRHEALWSETLGSELAAAADWVGRRLPQVSRLKWQTQRKKKGVGEADLVLLDQQTGFVLVLELKTVFDKFRTHVQLTNFEEQRVNFPKAISQAGQAAQAIADGRWPLRELFGKHAPETPRGVRHGVLTWWDNYNPTLGTDSPELCCNFASFLHAMGEAQGDVAAADMALRRVSEIYCAGVLLDDEIDLDGETFRFRREVQTEYLAPEQMVTEALDGGFAWDLISDLARLPEWPPTLQSAGPQWFLYDPNQ